MSSAQSTLTKAQKKEKGWFPFENKKDRFEDAGELYVKAANLFKIDKNLREAANAFESAANCFNAADNKHFAALNYIDAANCIKQTNPEKAIDLMTQAKELYSQEGRFQTTARLTKEIAELMEKDTRFDKFNPDPEYFHLVLSEYQKAADLFEAEGVKSSVQLCVKKISQIHILLGEYSQAANINESMAKQVLEGDSLLKFQAKEHLFMAGLCFIAMNDLVGAEKALDRFSQLSPQFAVSRESQFLQKLLKLSENQDPEGIAALVREYDSISSVDKEKISILLKIKMLSIPPNQPDFNITEDEGLA